MNLVPWCIKSDKQQWISYHQINNGDKKLTWVCSVQRIVSLKNCVQLLTYEITSKHRIERIYRETGYPGSSQYLHYTDLPTYYTYYTSGIIYRRYVSITCSQLDKVGNTLKAFGTFPLLYFLSTKPTFLYISTTLSSRSFTFVASEK